MGLFRWLTLHLVGTPPCSKKFSTPNFTRKVRSILSTIYEAFSQYILYIIESTVKMGQNYGYLVRKCCDQSFRSKIPRRSMANSTLTFVLSAFSLHVYVLFRHPPFAAAMREDCQASMTKNHQVMITF